MVQVQIFGNDGVTCHLFCFECFPRWFAQEFPGSPCARPPESFDN